MSEDLDKSEDATPYKLQEARKKGQVGKSTELPSFFSLLAMISVIVGSISYMASKISISVSWWLSNSHYLASNKVQVFEFVKAFFADVLMLLAPVVIAGVIAAVVANIVHVGVIFSFHPIKPDFSKINPGKGLKKIFSRKSLVELVKLVAKMLLFVSVAYAVWSSNSSLILNSNHASANYLLLSWNKFFVTFVYSLLAVFLISSVFDLWFSKKDFARQMRMSKRDVRDEIKRREGDPQIKSKRKKVISELLTKSASTKHVKDSDVIITNPTHVAVALQYRPNKMVLPIVLAKGKGLMAADIRRRAKQYNVPIVRKPELARALLKEVRIGDPIPEEMQTKVANIYRWVLALPIKNKVFD
ncbi:Flagellar biosynthetic protein FlhB [Thalassocella blandensis]|nr:Flagellar biosynthetic protein FlhB [Thalassocella blandensis]